MFPNHNNQQNQPWAPPQGQPNQPWSPPHGQPNQPYGSPHGQPNQPWSPPHDQPNQPWGSPNNQQFVQTSFSSQQTVQQSSYASRIENMHHQIYNQHIPSQPAPTDNNFRPTSAQHIPFGGSHSPQTNFGGHVPFQPYTQPISSPYGTPMNAFKQPTQSGNSNWLPSAKPASSKHIPFNLQRAHFNHDCGYIKADDLCKDLHDIKPDIKPAPEYKPEVRPEGKPEVKPEVKPVPHAEPEDSKEDLLRISMITSVFTKNPYFHHQDYVPPAPEQINHVDKQKEEEEAEREKDRLKQKVFAFFTQAGSDFFQFTSLLGKLKMTGEKYVDKDFPAEMKSLIGKNTMRKGEWGEVAWLRPDQFYGPGTYKIFQGKIEPNDIKQGQLGDCYFLSTLASLAEWPERIQDIFGTKDVNTCGCYCVKVCEMGEWKEVVIDDFFPCDKFTKTPIFTTGNEKELWVLILEKVWAKIYGSYDAIEAGLTRECLHDFTGAPTKFFLTDRKEEYEMIWRKIIKAEKKQYCMTCGADDFFQQNQIVNTVNNKGIVSSHAYSLLAGYEVRDRNGRPVRLIKLRNPWGKTEWTGPWSDSSNEWTEKLKEDLKLENKNDGIFFMAYEDFLKYFSDIQLCYIHDNHKYRCKRVTSSPRRAVYFKIRVTTPGKYYITVNQSSKRKNANNPHFMYSTVSIVTARMLPNQKYDYVTGNSRADREVWAKGLFEPGEYLVYAKVQWTSGRDSDFVLSTYGPGDTEIEVVKKQSYPGFLEQTFISKGKHSPKKMSYAREGEANCFSAVDISRDGFIFCYYQNNSSRTLETDIYFREFRGIKLRKPFRGREFKMVVPPGQEGIALLRILPNQDVKQVLSEKVRFVTATSSHGAGGYGGSTGATSGYGGSTGGAGGYSAGGSNPQVPNLDMEAKENGDMKRIKDSLTDEFVQVFIYQYRHDDGVYLYFENQTRDAVLEGKVICELRGLEPIGGTGAREIGFKIYPGSTHRIAFQKTSSSFDARFKYESRVVRV